jgi:dynein heavy chain
VYCTAGERWAKTVESLKQNYDVLTGDMLLAAAFVSYAGPFTTKVRASLITEWIKFLTDKGIRMTAGITGELWSLPKYR